MFGGVLTGESGWIEYGYDAAATLEKYTVTRNQTTGEYVLAARCVASNAYALTQRPLVFVVPTVRGDLRWPVLEFTVEGEAVWARLGPLMT
jgi:hypothetical protein